MKQITHDEMERVLDEAFIAAGLPQGAENPDVREKASYALGATAQLLIVKHEKLVAESAETQQLSRMMKQIVGVLSRSYAPLTSKEIGERIGVSALSVREVIKAQRDRLPSHGIQLRARIGRKGGYWLERTK